MSPEQEPPQPPEDRPADAKERESSQETINPVDVIEAVDSAAAYSLERTNGKAILGNAVADVLDMTKDLPPERKEKTEILIFASFVAKHGDQLFAGLKAELLNELNRRLNQ